MKKFYQISSIILFIGIILLVIGKVNNGDQGFDFFNIGSFRSDKRHDKGTHHDSVDNDNYDYEDDDDYNEGNRNHQAVETTNIPKFRKIKLDLFRPNVQISLGKKYQVKVSGPKSRKVNTSVKDRKLIVSDHKKHSFASFMGKSDAYMVEIIVPKKNAVKELTGTCSDSDLFLKEVIIPHIDLKINEGDMVVNNVIVQNAKVYLVDGDLEITNSTLTNGNLTLNEGDVTLMNSKLKMAANLNDGDVVITNSNLLGSSIFTLSEGDFKMVNAPKLDYDLSTDGESDIRFQGNYHSSHFIKRAGKLPVLKVVSKDGDIIID